ncbi:hypothetical protein [Tardiphaga sp.]|uniref:hypothetical protein n=1 Tax=Tardiphaga sp. TaxID=1926292 RepID=UPI00352A4B7B
MLRKMTLGLIAAASLGAAALAPSAASAHGWHIGGWHGGWGGYGHHAFYGGPAFYVGGLTDGCLQRRIVETRRGLRVRTVNVCAY